MVQRGSLYLQPTTGHRRRRRYGGKRLPACCDFLVIFSDFLVPTPTFKPATAYLLSSDFPEL